jgi:hypothetical protein
MKRFGRWSFNALAAMSVILLLGIGLVLWQICGMNPHPANPLTTEIGLSEIGLWSGRNGGVPIWIIICAVLPIPVVWVAIRLWAKSRPQHGFCSACGYDLRATPERCPECGKVVEKTI